MGIRRHHDGPAFVLAQPGALEDIGEEQFLLLRDGLGGKVVLGIAGFSSRPRNSRTSGSFSMSSGLSMIWPTRSRLRMPVLSRLSDAAADFEVGHHLEGVHDGGDAAAGGLDELADF
jgi:hypothetical protein